MTSVLFLSVLVAAAIGSAAAASHHFSPPSTPCRSHCANAPGSAECATCCRTARHHIPWNCPVPMGTHGDRNPLGDAHNGAAAACCTGEWNAACWNEPSAINYEHSCDMCISANTFDRNRGGCDGNWNTPECWTAGIPPNSQADILENRVYCEGEIIITTPVQSASLYMQTDACTVIIQPNGRLETTYLASNANNPQPINLMGQYGELQLNVSRIYSGTYNMLQLGLGVAHAILGLEQTWVRIMILAGAPGPNQNTGDVPGRLTLYTYPPNPRTQRYEEDLIRVETGVGRVIIEYNEISSLPLGPLAIAMSGSPPTHVTFSGAFIFPPFGRLGEQWGSNITITEPPALVMGPARIPTLVMYGTILQSNINTRLRPTYRLELSGAVVSSGAVIDLSDSPASSEFVLDGATVAPEAMISAPFKITCGTRCGGPFSYGECLATTGCTTGACAGVCSCPATTTIHYTSNCTNIDGQCSPACLGGSMCGSVSLCTGACPATATAHFSSDCQAQDGTCTNACLGGATCEVGGTCNTGCAATSTAHYAANCTTQDAVCAPACPFGMCAVSTTGTAGRCLCPATTTTAFYSADCRTTATCATACVGGTLCAGTNTCGANCPATRTAHFNAACNAQDGTCATACPYGLCKAGSTCACPASNATVGYGADCRSLFTCSNCLGGATCTGAGVCTGCTSTESTTYSTECTQVCATGYSGSNCGTYTSVAPAVTTGSGRIVFTFGAGNLTSIGTISAFIASVRSAVATSAGVAESRVSVAALTPAAGGAPGYTVTVDIAAGAASDPTVAAALASVGSNPPAAFGSVPVPAGAASCAGFSSCAEANTPAGGGESKKPRISDGAAIGIALAGLIAVIVVVSLIWYFCARDAPVFENKNDAARGRGQSAVEIH